MQKFQKQKSELKSMPIKEHISLYQDIAKKFDKNMTREIAKILVNRERERIVWVNDVYQVYQYSGALCDDMVHEECLKGKCDWLSIKRLDQEPCNDWADFQQIKNEICDPQREALQLYPSEERVVDTSNQYHLFVFPEDFYISFGWFTRIINDEDINLENFKTKQRRKYGA